MCKFIANALGLRAPKMAEFKPPVPTAQAVNMSDDTTGEEMAEANKRKKRGFLSTRASGTILGSSESGKKTLG